MIFKNVSTFLQLTAETACDFISPGPSIKKIRHSQPQDIREGLTTACKLVKEVRDVLCTRLMLNSKKICFSGKKHDTWRPFYEF